MRRLAVPLVALALLPTPLAGVSLVCWWWLVSGQMPGTTWARRALQGLVVVYAVDAAALTSMAVLDVPCDPRVLLAVLLVSGTVWLAASPRRRGVPVATRDDWLAAAFGALVFAVLYAPSAGASLGRTAALLSRTTDGATHVQILTAVARNDGYVHLLQPAGMSAGADHYPSGWHGALWLTGETVLGPTLTSGALIRLTAFGATATYALLCAAGAAWVLRLLTPTASIWVRGAALAVLGLSLVVGPGLLLAQLGSFTQIAAIAALLTLCTVRGAGGSAPYRTLVVAAAASVAVMHSWYLLAPLLAAVLLTVLPFRRVRPGAWAGAVLVTAPLCLYPVVTGPSAGQVDLPGPVLLPTLLGVLGLLGAGLVALVRYPRGEPAALPLVVLLVAALVSCVALVAREGASVDQPIPYYAAKLLLAALVLGAVLAAALAAQALARDRGLRAALTSALAAAGIVAGTASTADATLPPSMNRFDDRVHADTLDELLATQPRPGRYALVADGCDRVWDQVATKWWYDTSLTWTHEFALALVQHTHDARGTSRQLQAWLENDSVKGLDVFVHRACDPAALASLAAHPKVAVRRVR